jgi:hypothetical protein
MGSGWAGGKLAGCWNEKAARRRPFPNYLGLKRVLLGALAVSELPGPTGSNRTATNLTEPYQKAVPKRAAMANEIFAPFAIDKGATTNFVA